MPNTLAHFGVQGLLGHRLFSWIDPKWVLLGCVIPDMPWVMQRVVIGLALPVNLYDLRLYAICQATLLGCVILSGALALVAMESLPVFFVLAINSLAHLLLDSTQLKWANGVHVLAPFSWDLWNLGWYWPESVVTYAMTLLGGVYIMMIWRRSIGQPLWSSLPSVKKRLASGLCLVGYFFLPILMMSGAEQADNHFIQTLRHSESRVGKAVEFDRVPYLKHPKGDVVQTMAKEHLHVADNLIQQSALVSMKARFSSGDTLEVVDLHIHSSWVRDVASIVGLGMFGVMCVMSFRKKVRNAT